MQSFAGAETTRRFSSILNSTWPMTGRQPKYAGAQCHRVHDEPLVRLHDDRLPCPIGRRDGGARCDHRAARHRGRGVRLGVGHQVFFDLTE
jgi:hypothetical protein